MGKTLDPNERSFEENRWMGQEEQKYLQSMDTRIKVGCADRFLSLYGPADYRVHNLKNLGFFKIIYCFFEKIPGVFHGPYLVIASSYS